MASSIRDKCLVRASMPSLIGCNWRLRSEDCLYNASSFLPSAGSVTSWRGGQSFGSTGSMLLFAGNSAGTGSTGRAGISSTVGPLLKVGDATGVYVAASSRDTLPSTAWRPMLREDTRSLSVVMMLRIDSNVASDPEEDIATSRLELVTLELSKIVQCVKPRSQKLVNK